MKKLILPTTALLFGVTLLACGSGGNPNAGVGTTAAPPAATSTTPSPAATSAAPKVKAWGAGMYKVGEDIAPGSYKTAGAEGGCYWERLKDDSGSFDAIIANDNIDGPGRLKIATTDKFVKFSGDCQWIKA